MEIRYHRTSLIVNGWCKDPEQYGNLDRGDPDETVVVWDCEVPRGKTDYYLADPDTETITLNSAYTPPAPVRTFWAAVAEMNPGQAKPLHVTRTWEGRDYSVQCYVTEDMVDLYQAGELAVGDFVLVVFVDADWMQPIATQKVYKSW